MIRRLTKYHLRCFFETFIWFLHQLNKSNFRNHLLKEDKKKSLIILATGSSLKDDLTQGICNLLASDICVVNEFCKYPMFEELKQVLYILADPLYFCDERMRESDKKTIQILSKVNWNITIYVPYHYYQMVYKKI